jgi:hypothetical protein
MKHVHNEQECALCRKSLHWWNSQACVECGRTICHDHGSMVRRSYSTVLSSYCSACSHNKAQGSMQVETQHYTKDTVHN